MKIGLMVAVLALSFGFAKTATADDDYSMPAMSGIKEIVVQSARIADAKSSGECGISIGALDESFLKSMKSFSIPALSSLEAGPQKNNIARLDILPEIVTAKDPGRDCTSWISLTAQSRNSIIVPPIQAKRNVTIVFWRGGLMVNSGNGVHQQALIDAFDKLSNAFSSQYKNDQPPAL